MINEALPPVRRQGQKGVILFATLLSLLLLAVLVATIQTQERVNIRTMVGLIKASKDDAASDSVHERLRGLIALSMDSDPPPGIAPAFDGTPFVVSEGGRDWIVRVQDVEGLVDVYLAPPEVLSFLPINVPVFLAQRDRLRRELGRSERFPTLEASLVRLGVKGDDLLGIVTQSSQTGALRLRVLAKGLYQAAENSPAGIRENEPTVNVVVWVQ